MSRLYRFSAHLLCTLLLLFSFLLPSAVQVFPIAAQSHAAGEATLSTAHPTSGDVCRLASERSLESALREHGASVAGCVGTERFEATDDICRQSLDFDSKQVVFCPALRTLVQKHVLLLT